VGAERVIENFNECAPQFRIFLGGRRVPGVIFHTLLGDFTE